MPSILNDVIMHGQDSAALEAAHTLVRTLTSEGEYAAAMASKEPLEEALEEMGFDGLWKSSFQELAEDDGRECFDLTEKLIEVRYSAFCPGFGSNLLLSSLLYNYSHNVTSRNRCQCPGGSRNAACARRTYV